MGLLGVNKSTMDSSSQHANNLKTTTNGGWGGVNDMMLIKFQSELREEGEGV